MNTTLKPKMRMNWKQKNIVLKWYIAQKNHFGALCCDFCFSFSFFFSQTNFCCCLYKVLRLFCIIHCRWRIYLMPLSVCNVRLCFYCKSYRTLSNLLRKFNKQKAADRENTREKKTSDTHTHMLIYMYTATHHAHIIFGPVFARHEIKLNRLAECSSRDNTHSAYHDEKPKITLKYYFSQFVL